MSSAFDVITNECLTFIVTLGVFVGHTFESLLESTETLVWTADSAHLLNSHDFRCVVLCCVVVCCSLTWSSTVSSRTAAAHPARRTQIVIRKGRTGKLARGEKRLSKYAPVHRAVCARS